MKKYTTIAFDMGNTVIRFDHNISAEKIARLSELKHKEIYDMFFESDITIAFEKGEISTYEFHEKACRRLGVDVPYEKFIEIWNDIFWEDEGSCEIVRELKGKYRLILLSNVNRLHFEYIEKKFDIIKEFDELVLSYVVGAMKPDKKIYDDVVRRVDGDRDGILYIDDRADLVKAASELGIDSVRFETAEKLRDMLRFKKVI
ncbi:MAG: HAD family hydrolase [Candidatus Omnitrophota bacterium]